MSFHRHLGWCGLGGPIIKESCTSLLQTAPCLSPFFSMLLPDGWRFYILSKALYFLISSSTSQQCLINLRLFRSPYLPPEDKLRTWTFSIKCLESKSLEASHRCRRMLFSVIWLFAHSSLSSFCLSSYPSFCPSSSCLSDIQGCLLFFGSGWHQLIPGTIQRALNLGPVPEYNCF